MVVRVDQLPGEVVGEERAPRERRDASVDLDRVTSVYLTGGRAEKGRSALKYGWGGGDIWTQMKYTAKCKH